MNKKFGSVKVLFLPLLRVKAHQSRREARSLALLNKQRATLSGALSGATQRAEPPFTPNCVISHSFGTTKPRSFCLVSPKRRLQQ